MQRNIIIAIVLGISLLIILTLIRPTPQPVDDADRTPTPETPQPMTSVADVVHSFFDDLLVLAPPTQDEYAGARVYESLSTHAKTLVRRETITNDIALFVGIQDLPDDVSIVGIDEIGENSAIATVQLSYTGSESLRLVQLVRENEEWKIDTIKHGTPEQPLGAPVDTGATTTLPAPDTTDTKPTPVATGACYVGGCSGEVCSATPPGDFATTCMWEEWYACFRDATCTRQTDGTCGWTQTEALQTCLAKKKSSQSGRGLRP